MTNYRTMKPRPPGSIYDAITRAVGQVDGGLTRCAEEIERPRASLHAAGDPDTPARKKVKLTYAEAVKIASIGGVALAEHMAERAGGVFVPISDKGQADAIQDAIAHASKESGEAISAAILAIASAGNCNRSREKAGREIREAIAALTTMLGRIEAVAIAANDRAKEA